eukprot:g59658.t1
MDPPKLTNDKPDWELFESTLISVIGVTQPKTGLVDVPDSPTAEQFLDPFVKKEEGTEESQCPPKSRSEIPIVTSGTKPALKFASLATTSYYEQAEKTAANPARKQGLADQQHRIEENILQITQAKHSSGNL